MFIKSVSAFIESLKYFRQKFLKIFLSVLVCVCFQMTEATCLVTETVGSCQRFEIAEEDDNFSNSLEPYSLGISQPENTNLETQLLVFVSNSLPEQSLKQWSAQVEKAGGMLLLRGFIEDSPLKTVERVKALFGDAETPGFSIDPERFEQMGIQQVPAVAIVPAQENICEKEDCPKPVFGLVYGDVPLIDALSVLVRQNPGSIAETALMFLERYRGAF